MNTIKKLICSISLVGVTLAGTPTAYAGGARHSVNDRSVEARARVVDVEPVYETVRYSVPVESCRMDYGRSRSRSYTGPVVGAVIGGAVGHAVGHHKRNKQVGAVVGALLGGAIGADVARRHRVDHDTGPRRVCEVTDEVQTQRRLAGYEVTYRYAGAMFITHMDERPGKYVPVRVRVTPLV